MLCDPSSSICYVCTCVCCLCSHAHSFLSAQANKQCSAILKSHSLLFKMRRTEIDVSNPQFSFSLLTCKQTNSSLSLTHTHSLSHSLTLSLSLSHSLKQGGAYYLKNQPRVNAGPCTRCNAESRGTAATRMTR